MRPLSFTAHLEQAEQMFDSSTPCLSHLSPTSTRCTPLSQVTATVVTVIKWENKLDWKHGATHAVCHVVSEQKMHWISSSRLCVCSARIVWCNGGGCLFSCAACHREVHDCCISGPGNSPSVYSMSPSCLAFSAVHSWGHNTQCSRVLTGRCPHAAHNNVKYTHTEKA